MCNALDDGTCVCWVVVEHHDTVAYFDVTSDGLKEFSNTIDVGFDSHYALEVSPSVAYAADNSD